MTDDDYSLQAIDCECPVCSLVTDINALLHGRQMNTIWIALIDVLAQVIASTDDPRESLDDCRRKLGDFVNDPGERTLQ